ncbi:ATP-binding protein [Agarivorans sp. QJM3NY_25]|uniref:ATP-binding protein n=1 Tax=Agarivorans sp. QJM3NY_25 TaxID=3421430 RepID=UPI003D7E33AD
MQTLTLIRGLPGSGKSSLAASLAAVHLEADMYFVDALGNYHYRGEEIAQAHQWCQQQTAAYLALAKDVVVANTFVRQWEMAPYRALAKQYGARLKIICCTANYSNIHGVSLDTIEKMRQQWEA